MRWSILIATQGKRADRFAELLTGLMPQVTPDVEVLGLWNNGEKPLGQYRATLLEAAKGDYVSFVDDDDQVPPYYVQKVLEAADGVDYVGFRMQLFMSGRKQKPTYHSLAYGGWSDDKHGYYRDISHLNPIRRELALLVDYRTVGWPDDVNWADQLRATGMVRTENVISECMYTYLWDPTDSVQTVPSVPVRRRRSGRVSRRELAAQLAARRPEVFERPVVAWPGFRWI